MHRFSSFVKGLGTGAIIGMAIATTGTVMLGNNKNTKKKMSRAAKSVGNFMESVSYLIR